MLSKIHSKYTPTDCFFSDFAHWEITNKFYRQNYNKKPEKKNLLLLLVIASDGPSLLRLNKVIVQWLRKIS